MRTRLFTFAALAAALLTGLVLAGVAGAKGTNKLEAQLRGANERPMAAGTNRGRVEVTLKPAAGKVCWEFYITKINGKPNAAHIHKGAPGAAGPVFVPLGTTFKREGCTSAKKAQIQAIAAKPGAFYVNVHNAKHPAGAMRGQLKVES